MFDVLRNAEYEIRHSNVLAWLLQPEESHGIGSAFLQDFIRYLKESARDDLAFQEPSLEDGNVDVRREHKRVDIAVFFNAEKLLIAVENKTGESSAKHAAQVRAYEETLRKKHRGYTIRSVLLTTSDEESARERDFIHASWSEIYRVINSIRQRSAFQTHEGRKILAFLEQYLEVIQRMIIHPETSRDYFKRLLDNHRPILKRLLREREAVVNGVDRVLFGQLSDSCARTVDKLVSDFRQEPKRLRSEVRKFLNRDFRTWTNTPASYAWYYLYFSNEDMDATRKLLGVEWRLRWSIIFGHREVKLQLQIDLPRKSKRAARAAARIMEFMREIPVDVLDSERYPLDALWTGCFVIYIHPLLTEEDLVATPVSDIKEKAIRGMEDFLAGDFRRIETYFKCLAFDPRVSATDEAHNRPDG